MSEPLSDSLKKIGRGTGIAMVGMLVVLVFGFIIRLIVARYGSEADYGIYSLVLVVFSFATIFAGLGLYQGATRCIAYFRGTGEVAKVSGTIAVSLQLATAAGIIIAVAIFFSAEAIAVNIFHAPDLALALRIFAIAIPFSTLINVIVAIFRGFDRMEPQACFQYILFNVLFLFFVLAVALLALPFRAFFYAYLTAIVLTFIALAAYTTKKLRRPIISFDRRANISVRKELLLFSLPLLGTAMLSMTILWGDTLMLGYFKVPEVVGLYNAASPLARFIYLPMAVMLLIYTPVSTGLYSQNLMAELRRNYTILTKWVVSLTLPIFLVLCLFPEAVLNLFFGSSYIAAAPALRILLLGFIINNFFGPREGILIALGQSKFLLWSNSAVVALNVVLNIVLIPPLGMVGAAIASAVAFILASIIHTTKVYLLCGAQPFSRNLLKPVVVSVVLVFLFQLIVGGLTVTWWMLPLLFILYYAIYGAAVVLTRSFDQEDIAVLLEMEKRSGINTAAIKRILSRFV